LPVKLRSHYSFFRTHAIQHAKYATKKKAHGDFFSAMQQKTLDGVWNLSHCSWDKICSMEQIFIMFNSSPPSGTILWDKKVTPWPVLVVRCLLLSSLFLNCYKLVNETKQNFKATRI